MKFCPKCGCDLEEEKNFCAKCGYDIRKRLDENSQDHTDNTIVSKNYRTENNVIAADSSDSDRKNKTTDQLPKNQLSISKKSKLGIIAVCSVIVICIGFYLLGSSLSKPSNVIDKFQKAVASGNADELADILYSNDSRLKVNEKNIAPLLTYFKENPSYLNTIIQSLNKDVVVLEQGKGKIGTDENNTLSITTSGKMLLFFPNYKIAIKPSFIQVNTGIKDVIFSIDGREIGKSDTDNYSREFGPYIPGKYKLTANYQGEYVTLSEPHNLDLVSANDKVAIDVFTNVNYIQITSEYPDAELFVNGKATGFKVADAQNFGPLSADSKIYATYVRDGQTLKSNEYIVSPDDVYVELSFAEAEDIINSAEENISDLINWYTYYFTEAVNTNNFEMVSDYLYPGSQIYNAQQSYVSKIYNQGIKESIMSFNILSYQLSNDYKSGTISTEEVYDIYNNGKSTIKTFYYLYTFKYNELVGGYQLESIKTN